MRCCHLFSSAIQQPCNIQQSPTFRHPHDAPRPQEVQAVLRQLHRLPHHRRRRRQLLPPLTILCCCCIGGGRYVGRLCGRGQGS